MLPIAAATAPIAIAIATTLLIVTGALAWVWRRERAAVRLSDARAAAMSELSAEGMLLLDERERIVWISDAALEVLGVPGDVLLGRGLDEVADEELRRLFARIDLPVSRGHDDDVLVDRRRDGHPVQHLCLGGAELRTADGRYIGAALWLRDITSRLHAERRLEASEAQYRRLVETAQEIIWTCDENLVMTYCNPAIEDVLGFPVDVAVGRPLRDCLHPDRAEDDLAVIRTVLAGVPQEHETTLRRADGTDVEVAIDLVPLADDDGVTGVSGITRDVTAHRRAEAERERASTRHAAVAELGRRALELAEPYVLMQEAARTLSRVLELPTGVVLELDLDADVLRAVASAGADDALTSACELQSPAEQTSHAGLALRVGSHATFSDLRADTRFTGDAALREAGVRSGLALPILVRGRTFGLLAGYSPQARLFDAGEIAFAQSVANVVGSAVERVQLERADRERSLHDQLTGLPNRSLFMDRLRGSVARARRDESHTAVFTVGVDSFKLVNDEFGHGAGDDLLATIAQRLRTEVRAADTVARLGGDEFVILCEGLAGEHDAIALADKLAGLWADPFVLAVGEVFTTASIGVAVSQGGAAGADDLLRDADAAMHRAKRRGRGRFELFDEELRARAGERVRLERDLHRALEREQFRVVYQPVVDVRTRQVVGAEALLRWDHPDWGTVSPMEFIPVAEESGDIVAIGEWVLREACGQVSRWQQRWPEFRLSVNVSGRQVAEPGLPERVAAILAEEGLAPGTLGLEITESVLMEADGDPEVILARLREAGARLLLDDFGTGYSSLSYLKRFPLDTLKIDRSFVDGLGSEDEDSAIVAAIVQLASTLDLTVVAEGVETEEQLAQLLALQCDLAQGYLLSRPIDAPDLERLLGDTPEPVLRAA
ncbi:EAL domain-containing protein [Svornostia abyssi]|uniref:EAL domain-containing protein n=1 Tax=Svornostia abyssi TaxID=2898438 RepID=A0ABY5PMJ2_9ACTN|nr:EAL domain-containing protein [Parviterribacteraceae bacterium J379]